MTQHSWASMEIHEPCRMIWSLTPGYPILITWKSLYSPRKNVLAPRCANVGLFTGALEGHSCSAQEWAVRALQGNPVQAEGRPCSAFPPQDSRHLFHRTERSSCKEILEGSARCRGISYVLHSSLGFFWFKLSIQLISYFFLNCFFPLFILFFLSFSTSDA